MISHDTIEVMRERVVRLMGALSAMLVTTGGVAFADDTPTRYRCGDRDIDTDAKRCKCAADERADRDDDNQAICVKRAERPPPRKHAPTKPTHPQPGLRPVPPPDTDGDGVVDAVDGCRSDAETSNGFEDQDGCPDVVPSPGPSPNPPEPDLPQSPPVGPSRHGDELAIDEPTTSPRGGWLTRRKVAIGLGSAGVVSLGAAVALELGGRDAYDRYEAMPDGEGPRYQSANRKHLAAQGVAVGGTALVVVAGYLWLAPPRVHAVAVAPIAGPDGVNVAVVGGF